MHNTRGTWTRLALLVGLFGLALTLLPTGQSPTHSSSAAACGTDRRGRPAEHRGRDGRRHASDDLKFSPRMRKLFARRGLTFRTPSRRSRSAARRARRSSPALPHNHGVYWHDQPYGYGAFDDSRTIATSLRSVGYNTGFVGKYLNRYGQDRSLVTGGRPGYVPRGLDRLASRRCPARGLGRSMAASTTTSTRRTTSTAGSTTATVATTSPSSSATSRTAWRRPLLDQRAA